MNILVLCAGNSVRSILLEAILNDRGGGRVQAWSAGPHPTGSIHPQALKLLEEMDHDTSRLRSKSWDEFTGPDAPEIDMVITVCARVAGGACPVWPGQPVRAHWGLEDPAALPEDLWESGFRDAYDILDRRAGALLKHAIETLDPSELKATLDRIGKK